MTDEAPVEQVTVTAVGTAVSTGNRGRAVADRIQRAMSDAILAANAEGISTSEENSPVIRERMMAARQKALDEIREESEAALRGDPGTPKE